MKFYRTIAAALAVANFGVNPVRAAPLISVSGAVCDTTRERLYVTPPDPGVDRCTPSDRRSRGVKVTARSEKTGRILAQTRTSKNGAFVLKLRPGRYVIFVENGGYSLTVTLGNKRIRNIDFIRNIVFIAEDSGRTS